MLGVPDDLSRRVAGQDVNMIPTGGRGNVRRMRRQCRASSARRSPRSVVRLGRRAHDMHECQRARMPMRQRLRMLDDAIGHGTSIDGRDDVLWRLGRALGHDEDGCFRAPRRALKDVRLADATAVGRCAGPE